MTWHYRPFKVVTKHGVYYCVKEFFSGKNGGSWTEDPIFPQGDTKKELIESLELMLKDIKHHRTKTENI